MKLYCTTGEMADKSLDVIWNTSGANASKDRTTMKKLGRTFIETAEVDVPTTKTDLIGFLNKYKVAMAV